MFKIGELVFAKVKGFCPWPGKIMCRVARNQFKIFFYGTSQESLVKSDCIWTCRENMDDFSKKYGTKKEYSHALEEMKKTPEVFKVSSSDLCAHECLTCDPRKIKEPIRGKKGFQMRKSNVKVGVRKTKDNVKDFKAKSKVVAKNKSFKKIVKSKPRIKKERRSRRDNVFKKLLGKKNKPSEMDNDQVVTKNKSFKKIVNSKQIIEKEVDFHQENVPKVLLHDNESNQVAVEDKSEFGNQEKGSMKIKKREDRWFCSKETKNKEKNLNVKIELKETHLEKGVESGTESSLLKEIKDLSKIVLCEENNQDLDENCESEVAPVISLKPGSIEVFTVVSNNNKTEEILSTLMNVHDGQGKLKNYDIKMSAINESLAPQKFKYTFKEVDTSNDSFPYGGITATMSNMQPKRITSKGVDNIDESTENPKGVDHIESTENTKGVDENIKVVDHIEPTEKTKGADHIESIENVNEYLETTQKIKEPVEKINLEGSITEVWLKEDENESEAKAMMDIDDIIYGEDVLDLDVSYTMLDLSQENGDLSEVGQAGSSTGDSFKDLMDLEAVTEMSEMISPPNFEFFTWGND